MYPIASVGDRFDLALHELVKRLCVLVYEAQFLKFLIIVQLDRLNTFFSELFVHLFSQNLRFWKLNALKKLGFKLEFEEGKVSQIVDVRTEIDKGCCPPKLEDEISNLDDLDFPTKLLVNEYADILSMSNEEFTRQEGLRKRLRDSLCSLVKK